MAPVVCGDKALLYVPPYVGCHAGKVKLHSRAICLAQTLRERDVSIRSQNEPRVLAAAALQNEWGGDNYGKSLKALYLNVKKMNR